MVSQQNVFVFTCADPERDRGSAPPDKSQLAILVRTPIKITSYKASVQCVAIIGPPAKRHITPAKYQLNEIGNQLK